MKNMVKKISLFLLCAAVASVLFGSSVSMATNDPIPEEFNVNTYLKLDNQRSHVPDAPAGSQQQGQGQAGQQASQSQAPTGITAFILKTIDLLVKVIASLALLVFIIGALLTIASAGKDDRIEKGKNAMVYSLIGLVIAFFSFIIVTFVQSLLY